MEKYLVINRTIVFVIILSIKDDSSFKNWHFNSNYNLLSKIDMQAD